jgi:hypothetical protein
MPFDYDVDAARRLVVLRPADAPTLQDWVDVLDQLMADERIGAGFGIVSDRRHFSTAPPVEYVRESIRALADRRAFFGSRRVAIVTGHLATYGMARMGEAFAEDRGLAFRVFEDLDDAVNWATGTSE